MILQLDLIYSKLNFHILIPSQCSLFFYTVFVKWQCNLIGVLEERQVNPLAFSLIGIPPYQSLHTCSDKGSFGFQDEVVHSGFSAALDMVTCMQVCLLGTESFNFSFSLVKICIHNKLHMIVTYIFKLCLFFST